MRWNLRTPTVQNISGLPRQTRENGHFRPDTSYAMRLGTVLGGQAINRSGAGYYTFHFTFEEFWYTGVSVVFTLGILAALLAAMPRERQRQLAQPSARA